MYVYDQLIALGFGLEPGQGGDFHRWLVKRISSLGEPALACRVVIDLDEGAYEVHAFSGPMVHEWHASFTDGTPRALVIAAAKAALEGKTDADEDNDIVLSNN